MRRDDAGNSERTDRLKATARFLAATLAFSSLLVSQPSFAQIATTYSRDLMTFSAGETVAVSEQQNLTRSADFEIQNAGGHDLFSGAVITDQPGAGRTCDAADPVAITGDGVPAGPLSIADLTGGGIELDTLTSGQSATLTYSCQVN